MTLVLVPIPSESVKGTANVWLPFVQRIAERTRQHVNDHLSVSLNTSRLLAGQGYGEKWAADEIR